jgi:hypothetical protein
MIPAERFHSWAALISPSDLGVAVIAAGGGLALLAALVRSRQSLLRGLPGLVYFLLAAAAVRSWIDLSVELRAALAGVVAAALWLHFRYATREDDDEAAVQPPIDAPVRPSPSRRGDYLPSIEDPFRPPPTGVPWEPPVAVDEPGAGRGLRWFLLLVVAASAVLLIDDLNGYAGTLLAWEGPVSQQGFVPAINDGIGFERFLRERLLWDDGVLSAGHTSLFYGPPTFLLFDWIAAIPATLRLASVLATLLSMVVLFSFVRHSFGVTAAVAATAFFGLNTPILFYGRYGSSLAGTILAVLLAFHATWGFLGRGRWTLLRAGLCAVALFAATLQYSPGRLAVLFLLGTIPLVLLVEFRRTKWSHWIGALLIAVAAGGVWSFETANERQHYFLHARGEHVLGFFRNPDTIPALVGIDRRFPKEPMDTDRKLEVVRMVVAKTYAELVALTSPNPRPRTNGAVVLYDPPPMPLYFAPAAVLALLGVARSVAAWRSWRYATPLLFAAAYAVVLLFTNRVDPHRGALLLIPFALWVGLGADEAGRLARRLRTPSAVLLVLAVALAAAAALSDVTIRYRSRPADINPSMHALAEEIDSIRGPATVWFGRDHRELSWLALRILDKGLRRGEPAGKVLPQAMSDALRQDKGGPLGIAVRQATRMAREGTLLLGPRSLFSETARQLQSHGLRVVERDAAGFSYYRIDGGSKLTGVPDGELPPMPMVTPRPTPVRLTLSAGPTVYLSDRTADAVEYGFAEPRMNATWQGGRVVMGGVEYDKAIGTHAWTRIRFSVPADALVFQAIVGLSDEIRTCETASVEFELRGGDDAILWRSPIVDFATAPIPVEVPVAGLGHITLISTEAGDGRDCDHANWARAAFVLDAAR